MPLCMCPATLPPRGWACGLALTYCQISTFSRVMMEKPDMNGEAACPLAPLLLGLLGCPGLI